MWVSGAAQLSRAAQEAIAAEVQDGDILVSAISAWEVAMLAKAGCLALTMDPGFGLMPWPTYHRPDSFQWMCVYRSNPLTCRGSSTRT